MSMRRPEPTVIGPRRVDTSAIADLNTVFSESFTDRYRRDGMVGVRVPRLNPLIWQYALDDAADGAMMWVDEADEIVAFNIAHCSGSEGWMGPLAVRPDFQGQGVGTRIVTDAIAWLEQRSVRTIGLETMPRTVDNIGFYARLGFLPGHLTVTMLGDATHFDRGNAVRLSTVSAATRDDLLNACRRRLDGAAPGYDFTREFELTLELSIGDGVVIGDDPVRGFALWHTAALVEERAADELRVLKLFAEGPDVFARLIEIMETSAVEARLGRVGLRCQSRHPEAFRALVQRGYRVRWTDLRMSLDGYPEAAASDGEIVLSNWEI